MCDEYFTLASSEADSERTPVRLREGQDRARPSKCAGRPDSTKMPDVVPSM